METFLLFVQQLKAEGLYAADDPSLVAQQLHADMSHISTPGGETQTTLGHMQICFQLKSMEIPQRWCSKSH